MVGLGIGLSPNLPSYRVGAVTPPPDPDPVITSIPVSSFDTTAGDGTVSVNNETGIVSVTYGTTSTYARSTALPVTVGKRYRLHWIQGGASAGQLGLGSLVGGVNYRPNTGNSLGANTFDFAPNDLNLFINIGRAAAGTTEFSGFQLEEIPMLTFADTNPALLLASNFAATDAGTTIDAANQTVTIASTGTQVRSRATATLVVGKLYRLRYTISGASAFLGIGTAAGGQQYKSFYLSQLGTYEYEFTPGQTTVHFQFHRSSSGTAVISNIALQEVV